MVQRNKDGSFPAVPWDTNTVKENQMEKKSAALVQVVNNMTYSDTQMEMAKNHQPKFWKLVRCLKGIVFYNENFNFTYKNLL